MMKSTCTNTLQFDYDNKDLHSKSGYHSKQILQQSMQDECQEDSSNYLFQSAYTDSQTHSSDIFQENIYSENNNIFERESDSLIQQDYVTDLSNSVNNANNTEGVSILSNMQTNHEIASTFANQEQQFFEQQEKKIKIEEEEFDQSLYSTSDVNFSSQSSKYNSEELIEKVIKSNNIIKNIIKQYYNYLMKESNSSLISEFIIEKPVSYSKKLIKKYFKGITYNNSSLIKILKHEKYGKGLEYYLTFDAVEELQNSKVQNLEEHIQSIQFLKQCCVNRELLDSINFYKKRCKLPQI